MFGGAFFGEAMFAGEPASIILAPGQTTTTFKPGMSIKPAAPALSVATIKPEVSTGKADKPEGIIGL